MSTRSPEERAGSAAPADRGQAGELLFAISGREEFRERYRVEDEVGRGGMGAVFKVWDEKLRRALAMKVMAAGSGAGLDAATMAEREPRLLARFLDEAQVTSQIDHPGVVPVHDLGLDDHGRVFFTMKLVKGRDFKRILELVREGQEGWNATRALGVLLKVSEAMAFAHAKGVVHRDLKPANIMVGRFGETYVMDWGLAHVVGEKERRDLRVRSFDAAPPTIVKSSRREGGDPGSDSPLKTLDGEVVGTPSYMAPEQALGLLDLVGPRSDIYSVGCLLYQLLAGRAPYTPADGRISAGVVLRMLVDGPPTPVQEINRSVAPELVAVVEKAMARELDERYAAMEEMAEDLQAYLENRVVRAYRTGASAEFAKWVRRNRTFAAALGAALVLAIGGPAGIALVQSRAKKSLARANVEIQEYANRALEKEELATREKERADGNARMALRQSYVANILAADASLRVFAVPDAARRLEACAPELRGWEWSFLQRRADSSLFALPGDSSWVNAVVFDPSGERVFAGCASGAIFSWHADSGTPAGVLEPTSAPILCLAFRPDGAELVAGCNDGVIRTWSPASGRITATRQGHTSRVVALAYAPDGSVLVSGSADRAIALWDGASGESLRTLSGHTQEVSSLAFSPDGRRLASVSVDGSLRLWSTGTWKEIEKLPAALGKVCSVAYSQNGRRIATIADSGTVRIWNALTAKGMHAAEEHLDAGRGVAFSPDGEELATASKDKTVRLWATDSGRVRAVLLGHRAEVRSVIFDREGERIASGSSDGTVRLWDRTCNDPSSQLARYPERCNDVDAIALSADGSRVVSVAGGIAILRDCELGIPMVLFIDALGSEGGILSVALSSDDRSVVTVSRSKEARVWDLDSGEPLFVLRETEGGIRCAAFAPALGLVTGHESGAVRVWDPSSGEARSDLARMAKAVTHIACDPAGAWIAAAASDGELSAWNADGGQLYWSRASSGSGGAVTALATARDGTWLAAGRDRFVLQNGFLTPTAFALEIYEPSSGELRHDVLGHEDSVTSIASIVAGGRLVTGCKDRAVRIWDPQSGELVLALRRHDNPVTAVASPIDGTRILSASAREELRTWDSRPPQVQLQERERARRESAGRRASEAIQPAQLVVSILRLLERESSAVVRQANFWTGIPEPRTLARTAWAVAKFSGDTAAAYQRALVLAELACERAPDDASLRSVLAAAHHRIGHPAEALACLGPSAGDGARSVVDVALVCLSNCSEGRIEDARRAGVELQALLARAGGPEALLQNALVREAQAAIAALP